VSSAIAQLTVFDLLSEGRLNQNLRDGISGALIRVQGWGGAANDPNVVVSMYNALAFDGTGKPTGKADDAWVVDEQGLTDRVQMRTIYRDDTAYVTNGVLVARVSFPLEIGGNPEQAPLRLDLNDATLVAQINLDTGEIRGVLGGRWPTSSILSTIETFKDPKVLGRNICRDTGEFQFMRDFVCTRADIQATRDFDLTGRNCNALSTLIGFEARRARFGKHSSRPAVRTSCEAGLPPLNCN